MQKKEIKDDTFWPKNETPLLSETQISNFLHFNDTLAKNQVSTGRMLSNQNFNL